MIVKKPTLSTPTRVIALLIASGAMAGCDFATKLPDAPSAVGYDLKNKPPSVTDTSLLAEAPKAVDTRQLHSVAMPGANLSTGGSMAATRTSIGGRPGQAPLGYSSSTAGTASVMASAPTEADILARAQGMMTGQRTLTSSVTDSDIKLPPVSLPKVTAPKVTTTTVAAPTMTVKAPTLSVSTPSVTQTRTQTVAVSGGTMPTFPQAGYARGDQVTTSVQTSSVQNQVFSTAAYAPQQSVSLPPVTLPPVSIQQYQTTAVAAPVIQSAPAVTESYSSSSQSVVGYGGAAMGAAIDTSQYQMVDLPPVSTVSSYDSGYSNNTGYTDTGYSNTESYSSSSYSVVDQGGYGPQPLNSYTESTSYSSGVGTMATVPMPAEPGMITTRTAAAVYGDNYVASGMSYGPNPVAAQQVGVSGVYQGSNDTMMGPVGGYNSGQSFEMASLQPQIQTPTYQPSATISAPAVSMPAGGGIQILRARVANGAVLNVHPVVGVPSHVSNTLGRAISTQLGSPVVDASQIQAAPAVYDLRAKAQNGELIWSLHDESRTPLSAYSAFEPNSGWSGATDAVLAAMANGIADKLAANSVMQGGGSVDFASLPPVGAAAPINDSLQMMSSQSYTQPSYTETAALTAPTSMGRRAPVFSPSPRLHPRLSAASIGSRQRPASVETAALSAPAPSFDTLRPEGQNQQQAIGPRPVIFRGVTGAPGDGDQSLTREMSRLLAQSPANIAAGGTPGAVFLNAAVSLQSGGSADLIKIIWSVEDGNGQRIGQVVQENQVPKGQLDGNWGEDAYFATQGAREGVMELLKQAGAIG